MNLNQTNVNSKRRALLLGVSHTLVISVTFISLSCLTVFRNSKQADFVIPKLSENAPKLGVIVIYESSPVVYRPGPIAELSVSDDLVAEFSEHPKLKLLGIHSTESYAKTEGTLKNVLVLRLSRFANRLNWSFYASLITLFLIPGVETRDFQVTGELFDKDGNSILIPEITENSIYVQNWTEILLLPFYWFSKNESVIDPNIYKAVRIVTETSIYSSKLSEEIIADYKVIKTAPLDFGTYVLKAKIKDVQKVDSYYKSVIGGGGPPRKAKILPTHPETDDFVKVTVEYENESDANAHVHPFYFIPFPSLWELQRRISDPAQFPGAEIHTGQPQHITFIPFDPKTLLIFREASDRFVLEPRRSMKRIYYFQYPKGQYPEYFIYNGRKVEVN
ncbi:hypothetical protein JWG44_21870 [Leptospira sp. 201903071]|uniref:hypothetical protein n=1 Tax=Leptospira ainazelensis TaxID=2810034 RepID=UPI0019649B6C|nr:hypothetical protein [Leptospira ainazelensis]MBM9502904.1 hypothetical protein [Leptospira ainazelensis]